MPDDAEQNLDEANDPGQDQAKDSAKAERAGSAGCVHGYRVFPAGMDQALKSPAGQGTHLSGARVEGLTTTTVIIISRLTGNRKGVSKCSKGLILRELSEK